MPATDAAASPVITCVSLPGARGAIASCILGDEPPMLGIGDITLHAHQRSAVARIRQMMTEHGGALLCDSVGLGKTYVALAVASMYDAITIIAPASLGAMWRQALAVAHLDAEIISLEALGRGGPMERRRNFIIADEAHNFRNPCTRRYAALAQMCMLTPVLLLTATPLHNSRDDVSAVVALFLGARAYTMSDMELAPLMIRRDASTTDTSHDIPIVEHAPAHILHTSDDLLDAIIALPPPVPPSDGSVAHSLVLHGLARQWASSVAALIGALKRRIARAHGLLASLDAGRYPTAAELSAWVYAGDAVQLAFAELLAPAAAPVATLAATLRTHIAALSSLLAAARRSDDSALADYVREIRESHTGERIIAFSCYAETAESVYISLRCTGHAALLTARGATIASGPVSRGDVLGSFAPYNARHSTGHDHVTLLITTDLLSEGVNLQDASIVIHLDMPWTQARIDQRIGRLARMGSPHQRVLSYAVRPSARAESFLHEMEIIGRKSDRAAQILGEPLVTNVFEVGPERATVACAERIRAVIERWRYAGPAIIPASDAPVVTMALPTTDLAQHTALGAWMVDGVPVLLAWRDGQGITNDAAVVEHTVTLAEHASGAKTASPDPAGVSRVFRAARAWYDQRAAWLAVSGANGLGAAPRGRDARRSLARIADTATGATGFANRWESAAIASRLRRAASAPLPLAVEWSLESLSECGDEAAVNTILDLVDRARPAAGRVREPGIRCVALIFIAAKRGMHER